jgi:hypothetical protein
MCRHRAVRSEACSREGNFVRGNLPAKLARPCFSGWRRNRTERGAANLPPLLFLVGAGQVQTGNTANPQEALRVASSMTVPTRVR